MLGNWATDLLKVSTDTAKQKITALTNTDNLTSLVKNLINSGVPKDQAIKSVADTTTKQVMDTAKGIPTWLIIAGAGIVVLGGAIYFVTRD